MFYDLEGQAERKQQLYRKLVDYTMDYFDADGHWIGKEKAPAIRERIWYALGYFESADAAAAEAANRIIRATDFAKCHFTPMASLQVLTKYKAQLEQSTLTALTGYLTAALDDFKDADYDFRGANDNYATMASYTMLVGGQYFGRADYTATGIDRLRQLKALLTRRGFTTECNSPTYTPIQLYCMAEIAEAVRDQAVVRLALQLEERLWVDILSHYHPPTFQTAGPYSRAYAVDATGHTHTSRYVLYALLGEQLAVNPINTYFSTKTGKQGELIHHNVPYMQVNTGWIMNTVYHCPIPLVEHALNRTYPYRVQGTYECSSSTLHPQPQDPDTSDDTFEFAASSGTISTYMSEDYALGVMSGEFRTGVFTDSFHILYRRRNPVKMQGDLNAVYCKYVVNDRKIGEPIDYSALHWPNWTDGLLDEGRKIGLHHDRTAMLLYKPKLGLENQVTSLKLSLQFPIFHGGVEQIWLGDRRLEQSEGESAQPCPVFVKDGSVYMAFFPLLFTDHGRKKAIEVKKDGNYLFVSLYNYEGPTRDFAKRALLLTGNGFVAEVRSAAEVGSFDEFRKMFADVRITDEWAYGPRITRMRRTLYEREDLQLECVWSPISDGVKFMAVNGQIPAAPRLAITGLDVNKLPFLAEI